MRQIVLIIIVLVILSTALLITVDYIAIFNFNEPKNVVVDKTSSKTEKNELKDVEKSGLNTTNTKIETETEDELRFKQVKLLSFFSQKHKSPIVLEQYKLIWFLNPKVASTNTKYLLARMENQTVASSLPKDVPNNFKLLNDYPAWKAYQFLSNPGWIRVINLRDPKERVLSAYLGKEFRFHTSPRRASTPFRKKCFPEKCTNTKFEDCMYHNFTFGEFLDAIQICSERHWDPQYTFVDDWKYINFVINFKDLAGGVEKLLRKLGNDVWEHFGKTGWGLNGTSAVFVENLYHHSDSETRFDEFYTPELERVVEERYARDYELLQKYFPEDYNIKELLTSA